MLRYLCSIMFLYIRTIVTSACELFNNYSPKARWLSVNKNRDEVEVFIHENRRARGEEFFWYNFIGDYLEKNTHFFVI
jgi:hypothetical protein